MGKKNYLPYISGLIFLVLAIYLAGGFQSSINFLTGYTTLALTQASYISSDTFFNGEPAYSLTVAVDGSSGKSRGTISPNDILEFTNDKTPSNSFDIEVVLENQTCKYTVQTQSSIPVYAYSWVPTRVVGGAGGGFPPRDFGYISSGCAEYVAYTRFTACASISKTKIGEVYRIDSVSQYDSNLKINLITATENYETRLSTLVKSSEIEGTLRASFVGGLMGTQSCPIPSSDTVLYRPINTNQLLPKSSAYLSSLQLYKDTEPTPQNGYTDRTSLVNAFLASTGFSSAYCSGVQTIGQETIYSCTPQSPVSIPLVKLLVKADTLGIVVPSSQPEIIEVKTKLIEPATTFNLPVVIKNVGDETDSFDISVIGKREINTQPTRVSLSAGEQREVSVPIQGSGIIGDYKVLAVSANNPDMKDEYEFRIEIDMFCDRPAEAGKVKVSTEYGCYYLCQDTFKTDLREKTCEKFGTFETRGAYITYYQSSVTLNGTPIYSTTDYKDENHCLGIGKYTSLNNYMDNVKAGKIQPFVPSYKENAVWLPAPICNYVGLYGYTYDGTKSNQIQEIEYMTTPQANSGVTQTLETFTPTELEPKQTVEPPVIDAPVISETQENDYLPYILVAVIALIVIVAYVISRKK